MANMLNTITVDGVTRDAAEYAKEQALKEIKKNDNLGKDAFLQLLVAQMKYQDPLEPQDNSSFVAELAQFSALEQMTNVATNLESLSSIVSNMDTSVLVGQLSGMVGLNVDWQIENGEFDEDGNPLKQTLTGVIKGVNISGDEPTVNVQVGPTTYKLNISDIDRVYDKEDDSTTPTSTPINTGVNVSSSNRSALLGQLSGMIGMDIEWDQPVPNTYDENGDLMTVPLKGVVRGVNLEGEEPAIIAQIGTDTYRVALANIANVYFGMEENAPEAEEDADAVQAIEPTE